MEIKQPQIISIPADLTAKQLLDRLDRITTEEFHDAIKNSEYKYYGNISGSEFDIRNKKYGPYSNGPYVKGQITEQDNIVTIMIKIDIDEQMSTIKKMSYPYFIFLGLLIMAAGVFMNETRLITLAVGAFMLVFPFLQAIAIKQMLKSMQKDEVKYFTENLCHLSGNISNP
ncbi:MAG: hypothetical protein HUU48_06155 [Flavobacteriales bacterium]|nr:hypothetical protein [Flavobacteriales bacterium]